MRCSPASTQEPLKTTIGGNGINEVHNRQLVKLAGVLLDLEGEEDEVPVDHAFCLQFSMKATRFPPTRDVFDLYSDHKDASQRSQFSI